MVFFNSSLSKPVQGVNEFGPTFFIHVNCTFHLETSSKKSILFWGEKLSSQQAAICSCWERLGAAPVFVSVVWPSTTAVALPPPKIFQLHFLLGNDEQEDKFQP
jgi:hypothetical protein